MESRPTLHAVRAAAGTYELAFPGDDHGDPPRTVTVVPRERAASYDQAVAIALREIAAFTPLELELLRETARPLATPAPDPAAFEYRVQTSTETPLAERYPGPLHCPACCRKLGRGTDPVVAALRSCPGCGRTLFVQFADGMVFVLLQYAPRRPPEA